MILTFNNALVWSTRRFLHLAAAILFLSLRKILRSSSSGVILDGFEGFLPPIFLLVVVVAVLASLAGVNGGVGRLFESLELCDNEDCQRFDDFELFNISEVSDPEMYWLLPSTRGGTKPASFWWLSASHWSSMKVCSILRRVVGVNVGVVRVGTPEFKPSRVINCNKKNDNLIFVVYNYNLYESSVGWQEIWHNKDLLWHVRKGNKKNIRKVLTNEKTSCVYT